VALRATTASSVFLDGVPSGRAVFFCGDVFFASGGFAAVLRAPVSELDDEDVRGFAGRTFVRGTPRAAAGFRAGLAIRVTTIDVGKLPRSGTDIAKNPVGPIPLLANISIQGSLANTSC
jgi:hypothetical protein